jgi:outer membrane protein assembly factor BamB
MVTHIFRQRQAAVSTGLTAALAALLFIAFGALALYFRSHRSESVDISSGEGNTDLNEDLVHSWPQYLGRDRNGTSKEQGLLKRWPDAGPALLWDAELGGGYSSMAIARGRLVTMFYENGLEVVLCLNAETGKTIWRRSWEVNYAPQDQRFAQGPRSTPTIDGDRVYAVGATGIFVCLKLGDGAQLWKLDLTTKYVAEQLTWGVAFSPLIVGEMVITNPGGKQGAIVAFDKLSGKEVWKTGKEKASYSSPISISAAGEDQIVLFDQENLVGVSSANGQELWSMPWSTSYHLNITVPLWIDESFFISTGYGTGCARLKLIKKDDGSIDVEEVFRNKSLSNHFTNSVYYKGSIYGFDRDVGNFVCLDFATGKVRWEKPQLGRGQLLVVDDHIIIQTEGAEKKADDKESNARLILIEPATAEYREISAFVFSHDLKCWAAPAVANKKLYVRDHTKLYCFELGEK